MKPRLQHVLGLQRRLLAQPRTLPGPLSQRASELPRWRPFSTSVPRRVSPADGRGGGNHRTATATRVSGPASPRRAVAAAGLAGLVSALALLHLSSTSPTSLDSPADAVTSAFSAAAATAHSDPDPGPVFTSPSGLGSTAADNRDPELPRFRISEVRKHGADSETPWVIHEDKVYDITDWVPAHPGGQVILRAAGGSIDPYWNIFTIHKNQYVYDILAQYLIGYVDQADLVDGRPAQNEIEDPFDDDPQRDPSLITKTAKPRNAETPGEALSSQFLTPNELFYVRNHMWVPKIDESAADKFVLTVELVDGTTKQYTLHDLKSKFPSHAVTAVLQCSGNRRKHMTQGSGRSTNGLQWTAGAISNATWEGVLLSDVLADAGFEVSQALTGESEAKHVHFAGLEAYAASIPIKKAIDPQGDVLLAYSMNGKPLPRDHGYPLRSIVPGHVAARSVKWLNQITLSDEESTSQWQRRDYKCFGPNETKVDWDAAPAIQELPVQSAITEVKMGGWTKAVGDTARGQVIEPAQNVTLAGYAFSGGGHSIIRVDVSADGGKSWSQAYLLPDCDGKDGSPSPCQGNGAWSWKRWRYEAAIPLTAFREAEKTGGSEQVGAGEVDNEQAATHSDKKCTTVMVKATDDTYNTQPESHAATWNLRGNLATAWHRIQVCADCSSAPAPCVASDKKAPNPDNEGDG
ncbi:hypothetical protein JDV02_010575 [Purpureocillium takamizusanense]|uniref:Nitrate reductase [NADPH] n=1 Tax=Purpureocillium takamizusanense TaxID=2060973 RepID=A0A9Q8VHI8_9HYPO|nr:uncharacterized protein JDV02_010575 [Purpureocillium takamizusanense]UNI24857.1 hypothetical protein JDV02_010575 [Purpureocillium takamizusanense]